jgi:hypothetical protein
MSLVVDALVNMLAAGPDAVLPATRIGDHLPSATGELPSISISLTVDPPKGNGVGRFAHEGHQLSQSTIIVQAGFSLQFSSDLTMLTLPTPLRRNPSSHTAGFSDSDIAVRRFTDPSNPVSYRMVDRPAAREEFALEPLRALLRFGLPQQSGDKLEVMYWTIEFRDDIVPVRYAGYATLSVWATDAQEAAGLCRGIERTLSGPRETLRSYGFALLNPTRRAPAESISQPVGAGSAFAAWRQELGYRFAFETEPAGQTSSGGPIKRIDVQADDGLHEVFSVPPSA